jgi:hypothetical protein
MGNPASLSDLYKQDAEERRAEVAANPMKDAGAQIVGSVIPSPVNVIGKVGKGVQALTKVANPSVWGNILRGAAGASGASMALEGVRQSAQGLSGFDPEGFDTGKILKAGAIAAPFGALGGVIASRKKLAKNFFLILVG